MLGSILLFFVIFTILVTSHELGHFLIARMNGIRVTEFFIGMGPTLWQKKKGDTTYSIRLLPVGGACVFDGETGFETEEEQRVFDEHSFQNVSVWGRIATLFAGPFFNFILAYLVALILVSFSAWSFPTISGLTEDSAAAAAGLAEGDTILRMNGERVYSGQEVSLLSMFADGDPMEIVYQPAGSTETRTVSVLPRYDEAAERYFLGIYIGHYDSIPVIKAPLYAWYEVRYYLRATWKSLALLVHGKMRMDDFSGPVGMVKIVDESVETAKPYGLPSVLLTLMDLLILLSTNLGVMNLLPIPALDGGRLIFQFIEAIRGKPVPRDKEGIVHLAGMALLLVFMVIVLFNDIGKFL
ncbi:MAG: site-2 protease family protein [Butyrivibrio sp.]|nr:site-2 protease family protein [Butyrivibrio sp.]